MDTFGTIKNKILKQLTEAYIAKDRKQISKIINLLKENKNFLELYKFYDEVEEKYFEDVELAKIYVEAISEFMSDKSKYIRETCEKFENVLTESVGEINELYDALDQLLVSTNLRNVDKKIVARNKVVNYLTTEKPKEEENKVEKYTMNEALLSTILINNFNSKYNALLSEEDKKELKQIMEMSIEDIENSIQQIKENIEEKIEVLLNENQSLDLKVKLNEVKKRIDKMDNSRLSYYKMKQLEKDL